MNDNETWELAEARVGFKQHLLIYFIMNAFLWMVWTADNLRMANELWHFPWPIYPLVGWGIGLVFHYFGAYSNAVKKEYEKLKNNQ
jgi:hypothetical protein